MNNLDGVVVPLRVELNVDDINDWRLTLLLLTDQVDAAQSITDIGKLYRMTKTPFIVMPVVGETSQAVMNAHTDLITLRDELLENIAERKMALRSQAQQQQMMQMVQQMMTPNTGRFWDARRSGDGRCRSV